MNTINTTFFLKARRATALLAFSATLAGTGCVIDQQEQRHAAVQQREDSLLLQEDLRRIRARLDALEADMIRLGQQVNAANVDQGRAAQAQFQGINASLEELQRRIRAVDAAREADKKEVVESLSKRVADLLARQQPAPRPAAQPARRPLSNEGYNHTVASGDTLSGIARAYGVNAADIVAANNLKSADVLRVGQVLFIPAP